MGTANALIQVWDSNPARDLQNRIFPSSRISIPGLDYFGDWRPASGSAASAGDYLDYFEIDGGNLFLAIGDVAAAGPETAMLTSALHSTLRALRHQAGGNLPALVGTVDELFCEICPDNSYATLFVARYDPIRSRLHYVNAGHEPPIVLRKRRGQHRAIRLECGGPWIGMLRKSPYREGTISLENGDLLAVYTDGLCESRNAAGEEWGCGRLIESLQSRGPRRARDLVTRVFDAVERFTTGAERDQDMTLWLGAIEDVQRLPALRIADYCEEPVAA